jgi:hypothetical protein
MVMVPIVAVAEVLLFVRMIVHPEQESDDAPPTLRLPPSRT